MLHVVVLIPPSFHSFALFSTVWTVILLLLRRRRKRLDSPASLSPRRGMALSGGSLPWRPSCSNWNRNSGMADERSVSPSLHADSNLGALWGCFLQGIPVERNSQCQYESLLLKDPAALAADYKQQLQQLLATTIHRNLARKSQNQLSLVKAVLNSPAHCINFHVVDKARHFCWCFRGSCIRTTLSCSAVDFWFKYRKTRDSSNARPFAIIVWWCIAATRIYLWIADQDAYEWLALARL